MLTKLNTVPVLLGFLILATHPEGVALAADVCRMELLYPPDRNQIPFQFVDYSGEVVTPDGELSVKLKLKGEEIHFETFQVRKAEFQDYELRGPAYVAECRTAECGDSSYFPEIIEASFESGGRTIYFERPPILATIEGSTSTHIVPTKWDVSMGGIFLQLSAVQPTIKAGDLAKVRLTRRSPCL